MRALGAVLAVVLLTGCPGVPWRPDAYDTAARVEAVDLRFAPDGTGKLTLKLEVRNPSSDAGLLTGVDFELTVDGRRLSEGLQQLEVPLETDGRAQPVEVAFPLVAQRSEGSAGNPGAASHVSHEVRLNGGVLLRYGPRTERRAVFQVERRMELPWLPPPEPVLE